MGQLGFFDAGLAALAGTSFADFLFAEQHTAATHPIIQASKPLL